MRVNNSVHHWYTPNRHRLWMNAGVLHLQAFQYPSVLVILKLTNCKRWTFLSFPFRANTASTATSEPFPSTVKGVWKSRYAWLEYEAIVSFSLYNVSSNSSFYSNLFFAEVVWMQRGRDVWKVPDETGIITSQTWKDLYFGKVVGRLDRLDTAYSHWVSLDTFFTHDVPESTHLSLPNLHLGIFKFES